jgi:uncharacterized repeat protein (TIGR03847 family)
MGVFYEFDEIDAFTVGALGRPGQRVFLLQARKGTERVTVKCEKQQVAAMAEYLRRVLVDLPAPDDRPMPAAMELAAPAEQAFVLGPIGLGYDRENDRLLVQLEEVVPTDEEGEPDPEVDSGRGHVRLFLSRSQAHAFCEHADAVVGAGRPACIFCELPMDPDGHVCPRMN